MVAGMASTATLTISGSRSSSGGGGVSPPPASCVVNNIRPYTPDQNGQSHDDDQHHDKANGVQVACVPRSLSPRGLPTKGLAVIGAGLSRSGTESLQKALEILLGGSVYHGSTLLVKRGEFRLWMPTRSDGSAEALPDFDSIFVRRRDGDNFRAAVDLPVNAYVPELLQLFPNAIVVLTVRKSAEEWAHSFSSTVAPIMRVGEITNRVLCGALNDIVPVHQHIMLRAINCAKPWTLSKEQLVAAYHAHNNHIIRHVPPERLLVFETGAGWGPLCERLGLPIPNVPFPVSNRRDEFTKYYKGATRMILIEKKALVLAFLLVIALIVVMVFGMPFSA